MFVAVVSGQPKGSLHLGETRFRLSRLSGDIFIQDFVVSPRVREDGIRKILRGIHILQSKGILARLWETSL